MNIFLIGFMGCGKSTLGKKLARRLNYEFTDLDKEIERLTGLTVSDYFKVNSEAAFRELERSTLQNKALGADHVIATGGGLPCFFDNMQWMNTHGTTIYISLPPQSLANRLMKGKEERPLISHLHNDELVDFITQKLEEREVFYRKCKFILNGIDLSAEKIAAYLQL